MKTALAEMNQPPLFIQKFSCAISCREFSGIQLSEAIVGHSQVILTSFRVLRKRGVLKSS
jgi:hypothetical protein